jgi:FAD:protein FMN transferase
MRDANRITRRRAIRIVAAAAGVPLLIAAVRATAPEARFFHWHGDVLGAASELTLWHCDEALARRTIVKARAEIARYERIFSLYRQDSEIARLNRDGALMQPSPELRELIEASQRLGGLSGGAFDISVQPLWRLYAAHFWSRDRIEPDIVGRAQGVARALVDFRRIDAGARCIAFARAGMGVTLNGIAQGYVTDRIADLVRNEGFDSAVVDLGEVRVLGRHPHGRPWQVGIREARLGQGAHALPLADMALAVSGGYGTTFEPSGRFHHIFDPLSGASADKILDVAVLAPRAMVADGLSTAISVMGAERAPQLLAAFSGTRAIVTRPDGKRAMITAAGETAIS